MLKMVAHSVGAFGYVGEFSVPNGVIKMIVEKE
jgi:hypothetical protein